MSKVNIIGAGIAGLSAAIELSYNGIKCNLISLQDSERAQSVMAEGGINGALNVMGDDDSPEDHFNDTMKGGGYLADPEAVRNLTDNAPEMLKWLIKLGVPFNMEEGHILQRYFGGQKKRRTAFAKSSTGKMIVNALIDESRKFEDTGFITRYSHHELVKLLIEEGTCTGASVRDIYSDEVLYFSGPVILASGGLNGLFPEMTTGTTANKGAATCQAFFQGVKLSNLEMIQYHPTTVGIPGKRMLISEAARGEGGRLFAMKKSNLSSNNDEDDDPKDKNKEAESADVPYYFMEEKYPELGNLMPRDVVSREIYNAVRADDTGDQVYLDLTGLSSEVWDSNLSDLRNEIIEYMGIDPAENPVPVEPGIHYFMGGIDVDVDHKTNIKNLYAAGECSSQYHGANRLGGNSTMGALFGGRTAAKTAISELGDFDSKYGDEENFFVKVENSKVTEKEGAYIGFSTGSNFGVSEFDLELRDILYNALGIVRDETGLKSAIKKLESLKDRIMPTKENGEAEALAMYNAGKNGPEINYKLARIELGRVMLTSALLRTESRGAHFRSDYPETGEEIQRTVAEYNEEIGSTVWLEPIKE